MGQYDVLKVLEKYNKPLSRTEIANILKERPVKISAHINKLLKSNEIRFIEINTRKALKFYGSKRQMRLYIIRKNKKNYN